MNFQLANAHQLLVLTKFRYLGDTIVATPFLKRLKEAAPQAEITLLSGPLMPTLLQGIPYISHILSFDPKDKTSPGKRMRLRQLVGDLRDRRFDAAFLLNRSLHSAFVAWRAHIPHRIGFNTEYRGPLLTTRVAYDWGKTDRECAFDLLRALGVQPAPALPELWVSNQEREEAASLLSAQGVPPNSLLVGMQPGAHDPQVREWGAAKFAAAADALFRKRGAQVVLLGSREERAVSEQVASAMKSKPIVLTGETNLRQALAIISRCSLWIGNDGGLLHAAVALGPATVGIFGPTKAARWGYDAPRHRTITVLPEKPASDPQTIRLCLDAISIDTVLEAAIDVLGEQG